jgi:two-component system, NarL family, sensor histidine kinase BarA
MVGALIRRVIGNWTLERKSLLFFGTALLVSICVSFWFVHRVAEGLVMLTTRQAARDYAHTVVLWTHVVKFGQLPPASSLVSPRNRKGMDAEMLQSFQDMFLNTASYDYRIVALDSISQHTNLPDPTPPVDEFERELLSRLEAQVREKLVTARPAEFTLETEGASSAAIDAESRPAADARPAPEAPPAVDPEFEGAFSRSTPNAQPIFREAGPIGNSYVYYHPVSFQQQCFACHKPKSRSASPGPFDLAKDSPFLAVKVIMPYEATQLASAWILAVMIALAMVTLACTLLVLHLILRKLVIRPLRHLRDVSEEISQGQYNLRAEIDTNDEFHELAMAFNRMLRHLTESQEQLRSLNSELDRRVDQLAQANLHLYEANRLKSDFLANMSHELRTPLNSIIGFSDVLQDISSLTEKQKRYASNIQKSGRTLLEMINDILDLAKIEAGKLEVRPVLFDINQIVQAQCDMMRSLSEDKNIDLQVQVDPALEPVFQDQPKLQQVLTNLLSNALKFTPEGGFVTVTAGPLGDDRFHLTVADTGVGIPESDFEVIFEKFRQSSGVVQGDNLTRQFSGTGLGLSIVKELCKLLGGEIGLSSHVGKGSTFRVVLPRNFHQQSRSNLPAPVTAAAT